VSGPIVVVGDLLLDRDVSGVVSRLSPDAPVPVLTEMSTVERPGGAGLAANLLARDGVEVMLVAAVGTDPAGALLRSLLAARGIALLEIPYEGPTPEKIRFASGSQQLLRMERGTAEGTFGASPVELRSILARAAGVLVSDYGRGVTDLPAIRRMLTGVAGQVPVVWDPHPRGATPVPGAILVCPNRREAATFCARNGAELSAAPQTQHEVVAGQARLLRGTWHAHAVAVTLGEHGAVLADGEGDATVLPAPAAHHGDTCGAGDRFAASAAAAFATGASARRAVGDAVGAASRYVSAGGPVAVEPVTNPVEVTA
jgi:rfaE bifunctional protein kinase chain/domain